MQDIIFKPKKREYIKVPKKKQQNLLFMVFKEGHQIKQAASQLSIKYAAAKSIIEKSRKKHIQKKQGSYPKKKCSYKEISTKMTITFSVVVSQFGEIVQQKEYKFKKQ